MKDLYERARPVVTAGRQDIAELHGASNGARDAERLMLHLTAVLISYMAENDLVGCVDGEHGQEFDKRIAWAVSGLIFNMAMQMPRGRGEEPDIAESLSWWMGRVGSNVAKRARRLLRGEFLGESTFEVDDDGQIRPSAFDFRTHMGRPS